MTLTNVDTAIIRAALARGWLSVESAEAAQRHYPEARARGQAAHIGHSLVALGALQPGHIDALFAELGLTTPPATQAPPHAKTLIIGDSDSGAGGSDEGSNSGGSRDRFSRLLTDDRELAERYEVIEEVARGGMGAILLARDKVLDRSVAMKVLLRQQNSRSELRFLEEARVTGQLDHPNIVPVHDLGLREGHRYFTMKLVRGQSLRELIDRHRTGEVEVPLRRYLEVTTKVLDAIAFAHDRGVLHRDLKPDNIMIGEFGEVLVMDWGLAKVIGKPDHAATLADSGSSSTAAVASLRDGSQQNWTLDGSLCGTLHYMPPEQAEGRHETLDERADIYALGCILYEMLTLERAFEGGSVQDLIAKILSNTYTDPELAAPGVPPELAAVVRKALQPKRSLRYREVGELRADIEAYLEGRAVSARRDPLATRLRKWCQRNPAIASTGLVAALGLIVVAALVFAMPAQLVVELTRPPAGLVLTLDGAPLDAEQPRIEASVWPPGEVTVRAEAPGYLPFERRLVLASRANQTLDLRLERATAPLTVRSKSGGLKLILKSPSGEGLELEAPVYERPIPTGTYDYEVRSPDHFPLRGRLVLEAGQPQSLDAELESMVLWEAHAQSEILDREVVDVDEDGLLDLVVGTQDYIATYDLDRVHSRWRIEMPTRWSRRHDRGGFLQLADFDGDGRLEVAYQDGQRVHIVDAASGDEESSFIRFYSRIAAEDVDGDEDSEVICATPYRGVHAYAVSGERLWATLTDRYANSSGMQVFNLADGRRGLSVFTRGPARLQMLELSTGRPLWLRPISDRAQTLGVVPLTNEAGRARLVTLALGSVTAISADSGEVLWNHRLGGDDARWVGVGAFHEGGPTVLLAQGPQAITCLSEGGRPLWRRDLNAMGPGTFMTTPEGERRWLVPRRSPRDQAVIELHLLDEQGQSTEVFEVNNPSFSDPLLSFPPLLVDAFGDGSQSVLITAGNTLRLLKLEPQRGRIALAPWETFETLEDLDGDGVEERLTLSRDLVSCRGKHSWSCDLVGESTHNADWRRRAIATAPTFYDIDGDGIRDVIFLHGDWLRIASGRDGRTMLRRLIGPVRADSIICHGSGAQVLIALAGNDEVFAIAPGSKLDGQLAWSHRYNKPEGPMVFVADPIPALGLVEGGQLLTLRRFDDGEPLWTRPMSEISGPGGLLTLDGRLFVAGSLGLVEVYDASGERLASQRLLDGAVILRARRGPDGPELFIFGYEAKGILADARTLRPLRTIELAETRGRGTWRVNCEDINGDDIDEVFIITPEGYLTILDGRDSHRLLTSTRHRRDEFFSFTTDGAVEVGDADGDGRDDMLLTGTRTCTVFDIRGFVARARQDAVAATPLLELAYTARAALRSNREVAERRLGRLRGTRFEARAQLLTSSLEASLPTSAALAPSSKHLQQLLADLRAGRDLAEARPRTRALVQRSLETLPERLALLGATEEEVQALTAHIQNALLGADLAVAQLLERATRRRLLSDRHGEIELLEAAVRFCPDHALARTRYHAAVTRWATDLHMTFNRSEPKQILLRALRFAPSSALHLLVARIINARQQGHYEEVMGHIAQAQRLATAPDEAARAIAWAAFAQSGWLPPQPQEAARRAAWQAEVQRRLELIQGGVNEALRLAADDAFVRACTGLCLASLGQIPPAIENLERAARLGLDDPIGLNRSVWATLAGIHLEGGDLDRGLAALRNANLSGEPQPTDARLLNSAVTLALKLRRLEAAEQLLLELALCHSSEELQALERRRREVFIIRESERLAEREDPQALLLRGQARILKGDPAGGQSLVDAALSAASGLERERLGLDAARFTERFAEPAEARARITAELKLATQPAARSALLLLRARLSQREEQRAEARADALRAIALGASPEALLEVGLQDLLGDDEVRARLMAPAER